MQLFANPVLFQRRKIMTQYTTNTDNHKKKKHPKQIAAIIGILLLVLLYIATLISALVDSSAAKSWFRMCLFATVAVPLLLWIYIWMYGKLTGKHTIAEDTPSRPEEKEQIK